MRRVTIPCGLLAVLLLILNMPASAEQPVPSTASDPVTWEVVAGMQAARQALAVAAAPNGKLYAVGGTELSPINPEAQPLGLLEEYDPVADLWITRSPMPTPRADLALVLALNGILYALGGTGTDVRRRGSAPDTVLDTFEAYDPATDTWRTLPPLPSPRARPGAAVGPDGKIYVAGGTVGAERLTTLERYDPATGAWEALSPMPTPRWWLALAPAANGKLYAIGGLGEPVGDDVALERDPVAVVEEYDPATDIWTMRAPLSAPRWHLDAVAGPNGRIYAIGGHEASGPVATVEEYDVGQDTWAAVAPLPTARWGLGAAVTAEGFICAIGGVEGGRTLATVERATIGTRQE
jgi:N-acetylneuraminic acid mutarotase